MQNRLLTAIVSLCLWVAAMALTFAWYGWKLGLIITFIWLAA